MNKKLSVLISNDDGIFSEGISALIREIHTIANVTVVAPESQQSAVGHAITVHRPLRVREVKIEGAYSAYAVDGTPADCVKLATRHLMSSKPDLVISGINHGSNTAISIIYSGTVSAATEGTILGIPSFAVSLTSFESNVDYCYAAKFSKKLALLIAEKNLPNGTLLNVNVPPIPEEQIQGVVITKQGKSVWNDEFEARRDPGNRQYFWLKGELVELDNEEDIDQRAILNNKISITPIQFDLTNFEMLEKLRSWNISK